MTNRFWRWWFRLRFRYDVFISYTRKDSRAYALRLRDQLKALDFACFLDIDEAPAGGELTPTLRRAIRRSAVLVLVGSPEAAASAFVRLEIDEFLATRRDVVPIRFGGASGHLPHRDALRAEVIWIEDELAALRAGEPSPVVADTIDRRFKFTRRNVRVRLQIAATAAAFVTGAVVSTWMIWSGVKQATTATALAEDRQRAANDASDQAKLQRQEAERERDEANRQKNLAAAATARAERQRVAAEAASAHAKTEAARASHQEQLAIESASRATEQQARAQALYLVEQGLREADRSPLLGLRLALEGWFMAPQGDATLRTAIAGRLRDMAGTGRVVSIPVSPQTTKPFFIGRSPVFVVSSEAGSALRRLSDASVVTPLKGVVTKVEQVYEPKNDADALAHPESRLLFITYQDATSEIRDGSAGQLIVSGDIDDTLGTFGPNFGVRFKSKRIELRKTSDATAVVAELPPTSRYLEVNPTVPSLLFVTEESGALELRSIADGRLLDWVSGVSPIGARGAGSPDGSLFTLEREGKTYEDRWVELRDARTAQVVPLGEKAKNIHFGANDHIFVVGYRGRPGELRSAASTVPLAGEIAKCVFNSEGTLFAVSYENRTGEIRRADGTLLTRLPNPVASIELSADRRYFLIAYQWDDPKQPTLRQRRSLLDAPYELEPGQTAAELRRATDGMLVIRREGAAAILNTAAAPELYAFAGQANLPFDENVLLAVYHVRLGEVRVPVGKEPLQVYLVKNAPYLEIGPSFSTSPEGTFLVRNDTGTLVQIASYFHSSVIRERLSFNDTRTHYVLPNGELRRAADDRLLATIEQLTYFRPPSFSPERNLLVGCADRADDRHCELRRLSDGSLIKSVGNYDASEIKWSSQSEAFYLQHSNGTSALYRSSDGERLARADNLTFLPGSLAIFRTEQNRFEIWAVDTPRRLVDLGAGLTESRLSPDGRFLLTWFRDASPTIIDLVWLRAGNRIDAAPSPALIEWVCAPFADRNLVDLDALARYLSKPLTSAACTARLQAPVTR